MTLPVVLFIAGALLACVLAWAVLILVLWAVDGLTALSGRSTAPPRRGRH